MRKLLLTLIATAAVASAFAQDQAQLLLPRQQRLFLNDPTPSNGVPTKASASPVFKKTGVNHGNTRSISYATLGAKIGSSANIFTSLVPEQHCFGYKKIGSHDVFYLLHRQCNSFLVASDSSTSGYMEMDASINHGTSFDSSMHRVFVQTHNGKIRPRYPSGDLFVYNSDTNWLHAEAVGSGPVTNGSQWVANWFGNCKMDTSSKHYKIVKTNGTVDYSFPRLSTTATAHYVWALSYLENSNLTVGQNIRALGLYKGTYYPSGDTFSWTVTKLALPSRSNVAGTSNYLFGANMAWGNDGKTGYVVACHVDSSGPNNDHATYRIWKTTDEGNTWAASTFDPSKDSGMCKLLDSVPTLRANSGKKYFIPSNDEDLVVDNQGYLHIVTGYTGAYSNSQDSLSFTYSKFGGKTVLPFLVDMFQGPKNWSYFNIGKVQTLEVTSAVSTYLGGSGSANLTWGTRIQASCEYSTNKMFYTWIDSDPTANTSNIAPDIWVAALDLTNHKCMLPVDMTVNSAFTGQFYWLYAAKSILKTTNGSKDIYTIPAIVSLPMANQITLDGSLPHNHFYVNGMTIPVDSINVNAKGYVFSKCDLGTSEINNFGSITRVYPNPAQTKCTVEFTAQNGSNVTIEVTNLLGQSVYSQKLMPVVGMNRVSINTANYAPGMYLVVIKNGSGASTYKLVKE